MTKKTRNIGIKAKQPSQSCKDKNCPFHGNLPLRGRQFQGTVTSKDVHNSATVEWTRKVHIPKYERYLRKKTKVRAHNSPCINAEIGEKVKIIETRPLSKTKKFAIIEKLGKDIVYREKKEAIEADKAVETKKKPKEEKEKVKTEENKEKSTE